MLSWRLLGTRALNPEARVDYSVPPTFPIYIGVLLRAPAYIVAKEDMTTSQDFNFPHYCYMGEAVGLFITTSRSGSLSKADLETVW